MPDKDLQKEEIIKKYNLDDAKSNWKVSPSKFTALVSNLPTNFKLLTEFMLGKNKPININDFTKDELVSIITLAEKQEENKLNVKNRKLKGQPENITTVSGYDLKGRTKTFPDWVENNPYFTAMANSLSSPDYQVRTSLGKYDVEETPSSLIVKDAYDMNIKQRDLPKIGDRKNLSKILDYMRVDPEMAGEFISNIIRPNQNDSRKFDLVIPKRKPDQPSPKDTAYQAPMQLKEKPKDNPRVKEKVPEGFDILKFDEGGDVAAQTDNLFGYTDEAVTKEVDKYKENVNTELSFKDAATFVAEATPIIGDALAAKEVYDELQKNDPNYLLIGVLGGAALVGLIPGLGDAAASAIKTGAKKALDTAKRIEVDPSTLGSMGGNINLTPKAANSPDEPKIISFTKKKEDKELKDFNANLMSSISEQASKQAELVGELQEAGVYGDYQKGVRVQSQNYKGEALPPYTITGLSLNKVKLNSPNLKRTEDRLGIKFEYIEKDGDYYLPMLSVEQADGGKSQVYLDALKQRNTPIMDGPKDFNKGGAVMNEQMEMAFMQQGGLKDDGMAKDPVSGNNIPSGSLAKEVRDDIPAMLSEGEYVVPADVLRFYGVNFFENLRGQAKQGLNTMEQNGRIGGTPMTQQDVARNMQQVSPPPQPMAPAPVQAAQGAMMQSPLRIKQQPAPQAIGNSGIPAQGYAGEDGSLVSKWSPARARYSSPMFQGTSSQEDNIAAAQELAATEEITQMRNHYNQAGESIQVRYSGTSLDNMSVAEGQEDILSQYPLTEEEYLAYKKEMSKNSGGDDGGSGGGGGSGTTVSGGSDTSWMDGINFDDPASVKKWVESDDGLGMSGGARQLAGMGALGLIPQGIQANDVAKVRGIRSYYDSIGDNEMVQYLDGELKKAEKEGGLLFSALDKLGLISGDSYFNQIESNIPDLRRQFTDTSGDMVKDESGASVYKPGGIDVAMLDTSDDGPGLTAAEQHAVNTSRARAAASKAATEAAFEAGASTNTAEEIQDFKEKVEEAGGTWNVGGRAEGGLMTTPKLKKKKKSKPRKTGLAGKK